MVIAFSPYKLAVHSLIALITNEAIQWLNNRTQVEAFWHGVDTTLALGRAVVVVRTLEDKAETLGDESNLSRLSPAEKIKGYLTHAVILGHVVHCLTPAFEGTGEGLLRVVAAAAAFRAEALETRVLSMANGIIKIKLGGKVPLAVICMLTANIVGMEREKCLVGRHPGRTTVKEVHCKVELRQFYEQQMPNGEYVGLATYHVPHRVSLKAKFLLEVEEYVLYFLLRKWDRALGSPRRIRLTATAVLSCSKITQRWRRRAPTVERLC
jgi:hypothetical protein